MELHVEDLLVKFATYYVVLCNYVLVERVLCARFQRYEYEYDDWRWCAHDGHDHGRHAIQHDEPRCGSISTDDISLPALFTPALFTRSRPVR
jgi:hypothetical protein